MLLMKLFNYRVVRHTKQHPNVRSLICKDVRLHGRMSFQKMVLRITCEETESLALTLTPCQQLNFKEVESEADLKNNNFLWGEQQRRREKQLQTT